jgi:hypothetical protein
MRSLLQFKIKKGHARRFLFYSRKKHAIIPNSIIYAFTMGYFIFLFSLESGLCRYFFQNVKKTDGGGKNVIWNNGGLDYLFAPFCGEYTFTPFSLMDDSIVSLIEYILCFLYVSCIFNRETGF